MASLERLTVMTPRTGVSSVAETLPGILDDISSSPSTKTKQNPPKQNLKKKKSQVISVYHYKKEYFNKDSMQSVSVMIAQIICVFRTEYGTGAMHNVNALSRN